MKTHIKILTALLTITLLTTTANADKKANPNKDIKQQCQYIVHGNGQREAAIGMYMYGVISASMVMTDREEASDFAKTATRIDIRHKACQRALTNTEKLGFEVIYILEVMDVLTK